MSEEGPSVRVWRRALEAEGFGELLHEPSHRRVLRTLPSLVEPPGSAWRTPEGNWLVIFPREEGEPVPRVFGERSMLRRIERKLRSKRNGKLLSSVPSRVAGELPSTWSPVGEGWPAFEKALDQASKTAEAAAMRHVPEPGPSKVSKAGFRDVRELKY